MKTVVFWTFAFLFPCVLAATAQSKKPNIIFILADDLGWNDVSFNGYNEIRTPNIDRLAREGVILNSHYGHYLCTPSRAALLTGKYPIRTGMQNMLLIAGEARGLPLEEKIMPQYLKEFGYKTHMVGKWHLGYYDVRMTPTFRGFDSFFGFYGAGIDYFTYIQDGQAPPVQDYRGFDLWDNMEPALNYSGQYATEVFTEKAVEVIENHNFDDPLFLYLAHAAPHQSMNAADDGLQVPEAYAARYEHIRHEGRRKYAGMVGALDDSVEEVFRTLKKLDVLNNTIIVFSSDNGGPGREQFLPPLFFANNWPLRGAKTTQWEGGVRLASFVWSPLLEVPGRASNELYHLTDWIPTFYKLAGGNAINGTSIDGVDIWPSISSDLPSSREEVFIQANSVSGEYALRWHQYKVMLGLWTNNNIQIKGWFPPEDGINPSWLNTTGGVICRDLDPSKDAPCYPDEAACLFDVVVDPCEHNNIARDHPEILNQLLEKIRAYNATALPSNIMMPDPLGRPSLNGGFMKPWMGFNETN